MTLAFSHLHAFSHIHAFSHGHVCPGNHMHAFSHVHVCPEHPSALETVSPVAELAHPLICLLSSITRS